MHPSELKNHALVAAVVAELDGFTATAEALKSLAIACAAESRDLLLTAEPAANRNLSHSTRGGVRIDCLTH